MVEHFGVDEVRGESLGPRWNVAPSMPVTAVLSAKGRVPGDGPRRVLDTLRWGLVPSWAKDPSAGRRLVNARAETMATAPSFRSALARRRCLLPADGFYEWRSGGGGQRQAFLARPGTGDPLALAGLWEVWRDAEGVVLRSCTIVTTWANRVMAPIHGRMPVIVPPDGWSLWLADRSLSGDELAALVRPAPEEAVEPVAVGKAVNSVRNDGPELVEPLAPRDSSDTPERDLSGPPSQHDPPGAPTAPGGLVGWSCGP